MKPIRIVMGILVLGMVISCKSRDAKSHSSVASSSPDASPSLEHQPRATIESLEKKLTDRAWKGRLSAFQALRSEVFDVAAAESEPPMKIVASLIMSDQHDVRRLAILLEAFKETEMQIDLVKRLPAIGTPRRIVVRSLVERFESAKDARALIHLYDSITPGADRDGVGAARAKMAIQESGLVAGLEGIKNLERPSERYAAAFQTRDAWSPRLREPEVRSSIDEIANSMESPIDYSYKYFLSLMVENALREK